MQENANPRPMKGARTATRTSPRLKLESPNRSVVARKTEIPTAFPHALANTKSLPKTGSLHRSPRHHSRGGWLECQKVLSSFAERTNNPFRFATHGLLSVIRKNRREKSADDERDWSFMPRVLKLFCSAQMTITQEGIPQASFTKQPDCSETHTSSVTTNGLRYGLVNSLFAASSFVNFSVSGSNSSTLPMV